VWLTPLLLLLLVVVVVVLLLLLLLLLSVLKSPRRNCRAHGPCNHPTSASPTSNALGGLGVGGGSDSDTDPDLDLLPPPVLFVLKSTPDDTMAVFRPSDSGVLELAAA
jgi:hypothetical protein